MLTVRLRATPRRGAGALIAYAVPPGGAVPAGLARAAAAAGFAGRPEQVCVLPEPDGRALLLGIAGDATAPAWERLGAATVDAARDGERAGWARLTLDARGLPARGALAWAAGATLRGGRPSGDRRPGDGPRGIDLVLDRPRAAAAAWERIEAGLRGALCARALVAEPPNRLHPGGFAARLERLAEDGIAVDVLGRKRLQREGLEGLLAVGRAARHKPRLAVLRWRGSAAVPPVLLVGKGVTFDSGGLQLKPSGGLAAQGADMAGAAACAGALLALARRRCPLPAVAVLPLAENLPGADAWRPGDVLRLCGRSVEVVDTDAEGRVLLAEALGWAVRRFRPAAAITVATLTGAVVTALGGERAGLFGTAPPLLAAIAAAGERVGERVWPLPIAAADDDALRSAIADLRQCAPRGPHLPDAGHAAAFLRAFAGDCPWAHLDIAGVHRTEDGAPTGFGARLLDALFQRWFERVGR